MPTAATLAHHAFGTYRTERDAHDAVTAHPSGGQQHDRGHRSSSGGSAAAVDAKLQNAPVAEVQLESMIADSTSTLHATSVS